MNVKNKIDLKSQLLIFIFAIFKMLNTKVRTIIALDEVVLFNLSVKKMNVSICL